MCGLPRDAELGFARCSVCAFENFRRFPFCSLCGQELEHPELEKRPQLAHKTVERALTQRQQRVKCVRAPLLLLWTDTRSQWLGSHPTN